MFSTTEVLVNSAYADSENGIAATAECPTGWDDPRGRLGALHRVDLFRGLASGPVDDPDSDDETNEEDWDDDEDDDEDEDEDDWEDDEEDWDDDEDEDEDEDEDIPF